MDNEALKKSVIDQMMGELDGENEKSLKRAPGSPTKGVEISIIVSPKSEEAGEDGDEEACDVEGCEDPMHGHDEEAEAPESSDYISQLMKKLG
jgi:hypothetical protein